jgi:cytochrome b subunit of formate dehydrogenase/uncharacterized protein with PIN domain
MLLFGALPLAAQKNEECLDCHTDPELEMERDGKTVSVYVDTNRLSRSVHADADCIDCHAYLTGADFPHEEVKFQPVDCGECHEDEAALHAESLHGQALAKGDPLAPRCQACHGGHDIMPVKSTESNVGPIRVPFVCGQCHREGAPVQQQRDIPQDHILENYTESIHGEGLLKKGLTVSATCVSCHTAHHILPHTDPRSSIARTNIAATCAACHAQIEQVHRKIIEGELWEKKAHVLPACVDCHQPHKARRVFYEQGMADQDCLSCHEKPDVVSSRDGRSLYVSASDVAGSIHQKVACAQCHSQVSVAHERPCETITEKVNCGACHAEVQQQYVASKHGQLNAANDPNAPTCIECHGTHRVLGRKDAQSPIFPTKIPDLCARCHREGEKAARRYKGTERDILNRYAESIHGKGLLKSGLTVTATCTDCHTSHGELPADDAASSVHRDNVAQTCAQCHHGIYDQYVASVHSADVTKTEKVLPVCSDCHSAHSIARTDQDSFMLETMDRCGKCHEEIAETYFQTFHGKVSQLGYTKTAKCYDCHGAHDILPTSNPKSHLSRQNVVATCQKCHPQATRRFAGYLTHATHHDPHRYPWLFYTFWAMTGLLVGTFAVSGAHTLLWLPRAFAMRRRYAEEVHGRPEGRQFQRFTRLERACHALLIISFISLALTGLTLKFAYTPWAATLSRLLGGFQSAGYIHRVAAVLMFGVFITHLVDLTINKRRQSGSWKALLFGPNTLLFTRRDAREFAGSVRWFLGRGPRPRYGRWTYWEKFDYFAVFWGIFVIGSTGLMLWLPELFTRVLPGWLINVATIVHSDEALLAAGFIFTVHFFNTHLRPEKFPMDTVVFTGRVGLEELKVDKPDEYDALAASGELERRMVEPLPDIVVKGIRFFAWIALAVGVSIVLWIIAAMLFAYR